MIRILLVLVIIILAIVGGIWFSSQSLPDWYDENTGQIEQISLPPQAPAADDVVQVFAEELTTGELNLNESEFNALLLSSLKNDANGRKLLAVSDAVKAQIDYSGVEFGVVINLAKVSKFDSALRKQVDKVLGALPISSSDKIYVAVRGVPIVREGNLAFSENISVKIGALPVNNTILKQIGVPLYRVPQETLSLSPYFLQSVSLSQGTIQFQVEPRL